MTSPNGTISALSSNTDGVDGRVDVSPAGLDNSTGGAEMCANCGSDITAFTHKSDYTETSDSRHLEIPSTDWDDGRHGHSDWVSSVAFSPNGDRLASASLDGTIYIWDPHTGKRIAGPFEGHTSWVHSVAFSPDGRWLVSTGNESVHVWDISVTDSPLQMSHDDLDRILAPYPKSYGFPEPGLKEAKGGKSDYGWTLSSGVYLCIPNLWDSDSCSMDEVYIIPSPTTQLDFTRFVDGKSWVQCYTPHTAAVRRSRCHACARLTALHFPTRFQYRKCPRLRFPSIPRDHGSTI